jgi:hypothetical protein
LLSVTTWSIASAISSAIVSIINTGEEGAPPLIIGVILKLDFSLIDIILYNNYIIII